MRTLISGIALCLLAVGLSVPARSFADDDNVQALSAVESRAKSYVSAFNDRDADRCAEFWTTNADYALPDSNVRIQGRQAIREAIQKLLETDERFELSVSDQRFRQVSRDVVIEEGTAQLLSESHGLEQAQYLVVHVNHDGKWYRDSARETAVVPPASSAAELGELSWLIGDWRREDDRGSMKIHSEWINNQRFISRSFQVRGSDGYEVNGTQIIGWDPSNGVIRSWSFDSEGGIEEAVWTCDENRWLIKVSAVLPDGSTGSEQRILTSVDDSSFTHEVIEQQVNGQLMPGAEKVTLTRSSAR